jgi:hypothetical protein
MLRRIIRDCRSLVRGEPEVVLSWAAPLILLGMLFGVAAARFQQPGVITAVFATCLGASGGALRDWRQERGLWMLASLFLVINVAVYGLLNFGQAHDLMRGVPWGEFGLTIDVAIGTMLLASNVRFLWRVAKGNWTFTHLADEQQESEWT